MTKTNLANIQLLVLDVDGVLTDGTMILNADGTESKSFSLLDGHGIRLWQRAGMKPAFLSGRASESTMHRAKQLQVAECLQDCHHKLPVLKELLEKMGVSEENTAFVGDDLPDLPVLRRVGFAVTVPDEFMGDVNGDLNSRRGRILGMEAGVGGRQVIRAQVPEAEVLTYSTVLRSMTQGRGSYELKFDHYGEVPDHVAKTIMAEYQKSKSEDH